MARGETVPRLVGGRYTLLEPLGRGGMGTVWRAYDELLRRQVAVKHVALPPALGDDERSAVRDRVMREAQAAARLSHPALVTVFDVLEDDGSVHLVMELVEAPTLADTVDQGGPVPVEEAARVGLQLVGALDAAHRQGIVHRDVKPGNVMVLPSGAVKLTDFGIASVKDDPRLTGTGQVIGSPSYMSPEQALGTPESGPAADWWGLGATLYFAVEGRPPFDRPGALPTLTAVVNDDPAPTERAGPMAPLLGRLLAKDPQLRPEASELRDRLRELTEGQRPSSTGWAVLGATDVFSAPPDAAGSPAPAKDAGSTVESGSRPSEAPAPAEPATGAGHTTAAEAGSRPSEEPAKDAGSTAEAGPHPSEEAAPATGAENTVEAGPRPSEAAVPAKDAGSTVDAGPRPSEAAAPATDAGQTVAAADPSGVPTPAYGASPRREADGGRGRSDGPRTAGPAPAERALGTRARSDRPPRWVAVAALLVVVALVAGVLLWSATKDSDGPRQAAPDTAATTTAPADAGGPEGVPSDWVAYTDPRVGYRIAHPPGWRVRVLDGTRTDFVDPATGSYLRVDWTDTPGPSPEGAWESLSRSFGSRHRNYDEIRIEPTTFKGFDAAEWEYAYTAGNGRLHAVNLGMVTGTHGFALNFQTSEERWESSQPQFDAFKAWFQTPR